MPQFSLTKRMVSDTRPSDVTEGYAGRLAVEP